MKSLPIPLLFERVSRYYVFIFLNLYGWGKIAGGQFYRKGALPEEVAITALAEASAYDLAWTFMGYSFAYICFIGGSQIIGAWMLLWDRSKLIGVAILIPILLNVIVFDIIFLETKGALVNAGIYFLMLLYILYFNQVRVVGAFQSLVTKSTHALIGNKALFHFCTLALMGAIFFVDQFLVRLVGH